MSTVNIGSMEDVKKLNLESGQSIRLRICGPGPAVEAIFRGFSSSGYTEEILVECHGTIYRLTVGDIIELRPL